MTSDDHGHHHAHAHGDVLPGGWSVWSERPTLRAVLGLIVSAAVATVIGLIVLWPSGDGVTSASAIVDQLGLFSERYKATVTEVIEQRCSYSTADNPQECRVLSYRIENGPQAGVLVALPEANLEVERSVATLEVGDPVILGFREGAISFFFEDRDRRTSLVWLAGLFAIVVVALGRVRGILALASMAVTVAVLIAFVAPSVLDGNDPVLVAVVAASAIAFASLYLTHGFSPTTTVALAGTLAALLLTLGLSALFFSLAKFSGFAAEGALVLPFLDAELDVAGLLLGGAVIGALGALDDVTVTQVATVAELRRRRADLPVSELVRSGISIGREHIASTVNTLLLAYAGASMPLFLLFAASNRSLGLVANSEAVAVEIVRTLCGSIGLVAAVPITTVLAAVVTSALPGGDADGHHDPAAGVDADAGGDTPTWDDFSPDADTDSF